MRGTRTEVSGLSRRDRQSDLAKSGVSAHLGGAGSPSYRSTRLAPSDRSRARICTAYLPRSTAIRSMCILARKVAPELPQPLRQVPV